MAILRDITARLALQLDKRSFVQADKSIGGLTAQLGDLSSIVFGSGAALALGQIVSLGSDANETINVLNESFKENSKEVQNWASTFGAAAGRSEFELREMAGTLGAVLNPLLDRNSEAAAEMSTTLSELAVDLGSFFNTTDSDALQALRSGIVGETEPLKRFGIVMLESTLAAFALSQGITKNVKDMTIAEKTALRYNFILEQTAAAQGDAARTSEGWANASKGLISAFKDLGTRLGLTIIPFAEKAVTATRNVVRAFLEWQKGTKFLESALIVLGAIGAKVALGLLISWAPVIVPVLKFVAAVTLAALVLDDFLTFMDGGKSVIGAFIESIFGPGSAAAAADGLRMAWEGVVLFWRQEVIPGMQLLKGSLLGAAQEAGLIWDNFFSSFGEWVLENEKLLLGFADTVRSTLNEAASLLGINLNLETSESQRRAQLGTTLAGTRQLAAQERAGIRPSIAQAAPGGAGAVVDNSVTVNVQGGATARDATRIADSVEEKQRRQARRTRAALTQLAPAD